VSLPLADGPLEPKMVWRWGKEGRNEGNSVRKRHEANETDGKNYGKKKHKKGEGQRDGCNI